jgi:hypothetical protein
MKTFARKIYMFNNFLRLAEIKAVLEGRGFRPNFLVINLDVLTAEGAEDTEKEKRREKFTSC